MVIKPPPPVFHKQRQPDYPSQGNPASFLLLGNPASLHKGPWLSGPQLLEVWLCHRFFVLDIKLSEFFFDVKYQDLIRVKAPKTLQRTWPCSMICDLRLPAGPG